MKSISTVLIGSFVLMVFASLAGCCVSHSTSGSVNDVRYVMSLDRGAVPGGTPHAIDIRMGEEGDGTRGALWVDGVAFGAVESGDAVEVTDDAEVLVNGLVRAPE